MNYVQQTAYPLDLMIERLAELGARSTTLFLDACFSGLTREGQALLEGARPLVLVPVHRRVSGVSLFSAARGTQVASSFDAEGHGLFSFILFKGLAGAADGNADGRIVAGELKRFLEEEVPPAAARLDREQNPTIFLADEDHLLVRLP
jgi:uncharacterized caspase-like protein